MSYSKRDFHPPIRSLRSPGTGIRHGHPTLKLKVVGEDHQTELDASDRVDFMVKWRSRRVKNE